MGTVITSIRCWNSKRLQTVVPFAIQGDIREFQESLLSTNLTYTIRYLKVKGKDE